MNTERDTSPRIIIVDDNPYDTELMRAILQSTMNCSVVVLTTKEALMAALGAALPDVIISDSNVPGLNCMDVLESVRQKYPRVPFVFCSGSTSEELRKLAVEHGAKAWVSKNDLERLAVVVKRVCGVPPLKDSGAGSVE